MPSAGSSSLPRPPLSSPPFPIHFYIENFRVASLRTPGSCIQLLTFPDGLLTPNSSSLQILLLPQSSPFQKKATPLLQLLRLAPWSLPGLFSPCNSYTWSPRKLMAPSLKRTPVSLCTLSIATGFPVGHFLTAILPCPQLLFPGWPPHSSIGKVTKM